MGEGEAPALPQFPWLDLPEEQRLVSVWLQETNWFQGAEGEIDSSHVSTLHHSQTPEHTAILTKIHQKYTWLDPSPTLFLSDTDIGFMSIARRKAEGRFYWRATQWMMPMFSLIPSAIWPIGGRAWVPIDDENTYTWDFTYSLSGPIPEEFRTAALEKGLLFPPQAEYRPYRLNTGSIIDTYIPVRRQDNDYLVDREFQRTASTTGILGVNDQDRAMQEGMGRIVDRSREMLVAADLAVVTARRKVLDVLQSPEGLERFRRTIQDGTAFAVHPIDVVCDASELEEFLEQEVREPVT